MKEKMMNNLSLKIVSVLIAILIWLFATNENDPIITKSYKVKVSVTNDSYLDEMSKTYQINDEDCTVSVYLKGKKSVVSNRTDLVVEADLTQIVDITTNPTYVPVQLQSIPGISASDVTIMPQTIPVYIETIAEKDFMVTVNTTGTPGAGHEIGSCEANPKKVTIQGPKTIVDKIKSVVVTVDVTDITTDAVIKEQLTIIDQNGERLTSDSMSFLTIFNAGKNHTVEVDVKLWDIVDDVKVVANYSGTPAHGYQVGKIITTPETITVAGSLEALQSLKENDNTIEIPAELIDISGAEQDVELDIKLSSILKEEDGFKIPSDLTQTVYVKVNILPYGSREYYIDASHVRIEGLDPDMRVSFMQSQIAVRVSSDETGLDALTTGRIVSSMNLTGLKAGEHVVPLRVVLPIGYELVEDIEITIMLVESAGNS